MPRKTKPMLMRERQTLVYSRELFVRAPAERVFAVVKGIGGERGWLFANFLWRWRARMDEWTGGIGMMRRRRDPDELRVGDVVDFWRVQEFQPNRFLRLRAEMKLPGRAWLQFHVEPAEHGALLRSEALFKPDGILGDLYWGLLYPIHVFLFSGMLRAIAAQAEGGTGVLAARATTET
ncbi:MAG TPA: DUF2867 domain-containing protein [Terriglobales bacterium]